MQYGGILDGFSYKWHTKRANLVYTLKFSFRDSESPVLKSDQSWVLKVTWSGQDQTMTRIIFVLMWYVLAAFGCLFLLLFNFEFFHVLKYRFFLT